MKFQFARRTKALLLTLALVFSLAAPARAADDPTVTLQLIQGGALHSGNFKCDVGVSVTGVIKAENADGWMIAAVWSITTAAPEGVTGTVATLTPGNIEGAITSVDASPSCTIQCRGNGTATVTAKIYGKHKDDTAEKLLDTVSYTITIGYGTTIPTVDVTGVSLNKRSLSLIEGDEETLTALVKPDNATNKKVAWSTDNAAVATVENGKVTAVGAGKAKITVTTEDQDKTDACEVTVTAKTARVPVESVTITAEETSVEVGKTLELKCQVTPDNATDKSVDWSSDDSGIARVDRDGVVTGVKTGVTTITATAADRSGKTASVEITVVSPTVDFSVTPSRGKSPIDVGLVSSRPPLALTAGTDQAVTWSSDKPAVATVNANGEVTGVSPGVAAITAEAENGSKGTYMVTVSGLVMEKESYSIIVGYSETIAYQPYGAAATGNDTPRWTTIPESIATVTSGGRVTGLDPGSTTVRVTKGRYYAECKVTVAEDVADAIDRSLNAGEKLDFTGLRSDLDSRCREKTKAGLDYITNLQVATRQGILHYKYGSPDIPNHGVGGVDRYYVSGSGDGRRAISDLSFVPAGDFSGTAIIEYTGYSTEGVAFHGTIRVEVKNSGDVTYSTAVGRALTLTAKEFRDICQLKTSHNASYITFTQPSASKGTLYYNYSAGQWSQKVDGTTKYYLSSSPSVEKVTFVPAQNFSGTVSIPYRCTDTTGGSYSGNMTINVYAASGSASGGVEYTTGVNQRVTLNASDFNSACQNFNDRTLSYIYFESLPAASEGILYYNYTSSSSNRVDTSTRYNRSNTSPRISSITFVPASNFSGFVTIPYTGYDAAGQTYKDNLVINVSDAAGTVYYTTGVDDPVTFRSEDFNEACQRANNASLNYITFSLPSSTVGTLYRNYRSSSNPGTRISSSTRYYRGGTPSLSDITFVPKSRYEGTVSIPFTGRDANGDEFEGSVQISVGQGTGRVVSYSTASGGVVRFNASDFNAACRTATGDDLSYLSFELPASRYGTLYYQYNTARGSGTVVSSSSTYYRSGGSSYRLVDDVYFVSANVNGTASFQYTARSTGGKQFTGTVEIAIGNAALDSGYSNGTYYIGSADPISLRTVDFELACQTAVGGALSHIRFTSLPSESVGRLYMNYASPSRPGGLATTTSNYTASSGLTIGQLSFVPKAGYQGQVNIPYTGYSTQGSSFSGNVTINISTSYCPTPFYDVDYGWDWAKPSVEYLRYAGISNGYSNGTFRPSRSISRGEFTLMVCRAFGFDTTAKVSSFPDVPASSPYAGAIATAKSMGIVEGSGGRFRPDSAITRQSAMAIICRAMRAAGKKVPATGSSVLSAYGDQAQIASHARDSVAALVSLGVVQGSTNMRINPTRSISRAEMAVILHRVLTL